MNLKLIYIIIISIVTLWTLYIYFISDQTHKTELKRIELIENKMRQAKEFTNSHRLKTIPWNLPNLNTPRDCYNGSNYTCIWNEEANRCNQIE